MDLAGSAEIGGPRVWRHEDGRCCTRLRLSGPDPAGRYFDHEQHRRPGEISMFYVYVLFSEKDGNFYVGYTANLKNRVLKHNSGEVQSTKWRRPLLLVYYEASINKSDALHREKYLKTSYGKRYIKNRLKNDTGFDG